VAADLRLRTRGPWYRPLLTPNVIKPLKHRVRGIVRTAVHCDTIKLRKLQNKQTRKDHKVVRLTSHRRLVLGELVCRTSIKKKSHTGHHEAQFQITIPPPRWFQLTFTRSYWFDGRSLYLLSLPCTTPQTAPACGQNWNQQQRCSRRVA
jgi:hypothetical protein